MALFLWLIISILSYNIPKGPYSFQFGNDVWNFTNLIHMNHQVNSFLVGDDIFYTTFLDNITTNDIPDFFPDEYSNQFSVIKCNSKSQKCYPIISNNDFYVNGIPNTNNDSNHIGISFQGKSRPISIDSKYIYYQVTHQFYCNHSKILTNPQFLLTKDDTINELFHLTITYQSSFGCPTYEGTFMNSNQKLINQGTNSDIYQESLPFTFINYTKGDYKTELNLTKYCKTYETNVYSYGFKHEHKLFYNPVASIHCPEGYECNDNEEALVWICSNKECDAYGLLHNQFQPELAYFDGIISVIDITYFGDNGESAIVRFECDRSILNDTIRLPNSIQFNNLTVSFSVGVKDTCPVSLVPNPSPLPAVHLPIPQCTLSPSPNPNPTSLLFVRNSTHYTAFDIGQLKQNAFRGILPLLVDQSLGQMYTEYSPWDLLPCPKGWTCPYSKEANVWGCWEANADEIDEILSSNTKLINNSHYANSNLIPYCHPLGDKQLEAKMIPIAPNQLERGVLLKYLGLRKISTEMKIECNNLTSPPLLLLDSSYAIFHRALNGPDVSFNLSSSLVCPHEFPNSIFPTPLPYPTPSFDPDKHVIYEYTSPIINKQHIKLNLSALQEIQQWIVLGINDLFELTFIAFNPSEQIECPSNYDCNKMNSANAWKCSKSFKCFSIADARYNLTFDLINQSDLLKGVSVEYKGGYANYSFRINMICNPNKKGKLLEFPELNLQDSRNERLLILNVSTNYSCPVSINSNNDNDDLYISPGSVFILCILLLVIAYLTCGSIIVYCKTGIINIPNAEFWTEFFANASFAFLYLVRCGQVEDTKHRASYTGISSN